MGAFGFDIIEFVNRAAREASRHGIGGTRAETLEQIRGLTQTVEQLRNRWQTVQTHALAAITNESAFAKEAAWDQGVLGAQSAFFTTAKITILAASLGHAGPALWAAGNAATAGQALAQASLVCGKWFVEEALVTFGGFPALKALFVPKPGQPLPVLASPSAGGDEAVRLADALMRAVVDAKEEMWKKAQGTASYRGIRALWAGKEVSAATYWAYYRYEKQCWQRIQDMIRALMRFAEQDLNARRAQLAEWDRKGYFTTPLP